MDRMIYYLVTFFESILAVFGIRTFEQPPYRVVATLDRGVEIRAYTPAKAVETDGAQRESFERLFRYITGANDGGATIGMTAPVSRSGAMIAMTTPVAQERGNRGAMRFFLPASVAASGPPKPTDPRVRIVDVPAQIFAVLRFSWTIDPASVARHETILRDVIAKAGREPNGALTILGYDPPFTIPFLRRNEVALPLID